MASLLWVLAAVNTVGALATYVWWEFIRVRDLQPPRKKRVPQPSLCAEHDRSYTINEVGTSVRYTGRIVRTTFCKCTHDRQCEACRRFE